MEICELMERKTYRFSEMFKQEKFKAQFDRAMIGLGIVTLIYIVRNLAYLIRIRTVGEDR